MPEKLLAFRESGYWKEHAKGKKAKISFNSL